jgi:hypothetical protein
MRLPLLIEGNVKKIDLCATALLPSGKWKIVADNHVDSIFHPPIGAIIEGGRVFINFIIKGCETNLSIYAEKCL